MFAWMRKPVSILMLVIVFFSSVLSMPKNVHADTCQIKDVKFADNSGKYELDGVPFFPGYHQDKSFKIVNITTNNDPSCDNKNVYLTIFSRTKPTGGGYDTPLDNVNNLQLTLKKSNELTGTPEYGISASFYSGEEKCYSYGYDDLKKKIKEKVDSGVQTWDQAKAELEYLTKDQKKRDLYGFLFNDPTYSTTKINTGPETTTSNYYALTDYTMWETKKIMYRNFGSAVECGYYARAQLDAPMNISNITGDENNPLNPPLAKIVPSDYPSNYIGYMCNVSDYVYSISNVPGKFAQVAAAAGAGAVIGSFIPIVGTAVGAVVGTVAGIVIANSVNGFTDDVAAIPDDISAGIQHSFSSNYCEENTTKWELRNATDSFSGGGFDNNDPCAPGGAPIPGCYELLAPIPGLGQTINFDGTDTEEPFALEKFFTAAINVAIGATSVIALLALLYYGFRMMRDRSIGDVSGMKVDKARILNVFWGLGIILGSYVILNTINPELLVIAPNLNEVTLNSNAEKLKNISDSGFQFSGSSGGNGQLPDPTKFEIKNISYAGTKAYMKSHYFPAMGKALPSTPKGIKTLMAAHTYMEGFYPPTKAWRTNNPGNIGNTDNGSTKSFATLEEGIQKQYAHFTNTVINAKKGGAYYVGRRVKDGGGSSDLKDKNGNRIPYPAVDFVYDGSLHQYLAIYATAGRMDNTYLSFFISYFKSEGITITPFTKMSEIANMN